MSRRFDAFTQPPSEGWMPTVGERVYIKSGFVSTATVIAILASDVVKVRLRYGARTIQKQLLLRDIRRIPERKTRRKAER